MSKREQVHIGGDSGRVKVFVRIRPLNKEEVLNKTRNVLKVSEDKCQISILPDAKKRPDKVFQFDHIFPPSKSNHQVCEKLSEPIVNSALNGFNGTLMAYGQTGTGKTHTLMAPDGIAQEIIHKVFDQMHIDGIHDYKVSASYLQIYQEKIHDLLNFNNKVELNIREKPKSGIYVENLTEYIIRSATEALSLMMFGKKRLVFAETKMNRTSSRSHSVFQLAIEKTPRKDRHNTIEDRESKRLRAGANKNTAETVVQMIGLEDDVIVKGKIHLCDLAGSERVKKTHAFGERLQEAQHINSSLLELGNVIQALADEKTTHVPFRNSVLTRLLQESLGGNCKTSLIVCVSPGSKDMSETKSTLHFGSRAMKIENTAYVNMEVDYKRLSESLLKRLELQEGELGRLRKAEKQNEKSEEVKEREENLNQVLQQSEVLIKSLRTAHDIEVQSLSAKVAELTEELKLQNLEIERLASENDSMKKEKEKEEKIARVLLINEIASLEMLSAVEFERMNSKNANESKNENISEELIEQCAALLKYATLLLKGSRIPSQDIAFENSFLVKDVMQRKHMAAWDYMKSVLVESKRRLEIKLKNIFQTEIPINGLEATRKSTLWDLCNILTDKGFLASHIALENHELRKQMKSLMKKNEVDVVDVVEHEMQSTEEYTKKLKKALEEQTTDADKAFSGFEFTLSKIEEMLAEKTKVEKKVASTEKSGEKEERKEIEQKLNKNDENERYEITSRENKVAEGGNCEEVIGSRVSKANTEVHDIGDGPKNEKELLMTSITEKQEKNLQEFLSHDKNKETWRMTKERMLEGKFEINEEKSLKQLSLNELKALKEEEEDDTLSALISDAEEFSGALNEYLDIGEEIKEVQSEIKRRKAKRKAKEKKEIELVSIDGVLTKYIPQGEKYGSNASEIVLIGNDCKLIHGHDNVNVLSIKKSERIKNVMEYRSINETGKQGLKNDVILGVEIDSVKCKYPMPFLMPWAPQPLQDFTVCLNGIEQVDSQSDELSTGCNSVYPVLLKDVFRVEQCDKERSDTKFRKNESTNSLSLYLTGNYVNHTTDIERRNEKLCENNIDRDEYDSLSFAENGVGIEGMKRWSKEGNISKLLAIKNGMRNEMQVENKEQMELLCEDYSMLHLRRKDYHLLPSDFLSSCKKSKNTNSDPKKIVHMLNNLENGQLEKRNQDEDQKIDELHKKSINHQDTECLEEIRSENYSETPDENLNLKIERLSEVSEEKKNDSRNKVGRKIENRNKSNRYLARESCNLLEVQIVSGNQGDNRYGDSFLSPLSPNFTDDNSEEARDKNGCEDTSEACMTSPDVACPNEKFEDVVVKKTWSFSNWIWGKRVKRDFIEEETKTVCQ